MGPEQRGDIHGGEEGGHLITWGGWLGGLGGKQGIAEMGLGSRY